jgi:hypothetical protein
MNRIRRLFGGFVSRSPKALREPLVSLFSERPVVLPIIATALSVVSVTLIDGASITSLNPIFLLTSTVAALALSRNIVAAYMPSGPWVFLAQRPGSPIRYFAVALVLACCVSFVLTEVPLVLALVRGAELSWFGQMTVANAVWIFTLTALTFGLSSLTAQDVALALAVLVVSTLQVVIGESIGLGLQGMTVLAWLLIPVDPLLLLWQGGGGALPVQDVFHVGAYPLLWLGVGFYRVARRDL